MEEGVMIEGAVDVKYYDKLPTKSRRCPDHNISDFFRVEYYGDTDFE